MKFSSWNTLTSVMVHRWASMAEVARWRRCMPSGDTWCWWRGQEIVIESVPLGYCEQRKWRRMQSSSSGSSIRVC